MGEYEWAGGLVRWCSVRGAGGGLVSHLLFLAHQELPPLLLSVR